MKKIVQFMILMIMSSVVALAEPTVHDIYRSVQQGELHRADQMVEAVLQRHPNSAKAHYVAAVVFAKEGRLASAQSQLQRAKEINPTLSFVNPRDVMALEEHLRPHYSSNNSYGSSTLVPETKKSSSWFTWLLVIGAIVLLFLFLKKRSSRRGFNPNAPMANGAGHNTPNNNGGGSFGGGGFFSNILGGLAMGAGFAAGEKAVESMFGDDENSNISNSYDASAAPMDYSNDTFDNDTDFGIDDTTSWDDGDFGTDDSSW